MIYRKYLLNGKMTERKFILSRGDEELIYSLCDRLEDLNLKEDNETEY